MRIDRSGKVYANGEMRAVVVREIGPRDASNSIDTLVFNGITTEISEDIMLAYLIRVTDGNVRVLLTTESDLKRRGFERLLAYPIEDAAYPGHEACEAHS